MCLLTGNPCILPAKIRQCGPGTGLIQLLLRILFCILACVSSVGTLTKSINNYDSTGISTGVQGQTAILSSLTKLLRGGADIEYNNSEDIDKFGYIVNLGHGNTSLYIPVSKDLCRSSRDCLVECKYKYHKLKWLDSPSKSLNGIAFF